MFNSKKILVMKHIDLENETVLTMNYYEVEIINAAINNRMIYLQKLMKENPEENRWAEIVWSKCLDLQCEFFEVGAKKGEPQ